MTAFSLQLSRARCTCAGQGSPRPPRAQPVTLSEITLQSPFSRRWHWSTEGKQSLFCYRDYLGRQKLLSAHGSSYPACRPPFLEASASLRVCICSFARVCVSASWRALRPVDTRSTTARLSCAGVTHTYSSLFLTAKSNSNSTSLIIKLYYKKL